MVVGAGGPGALRSPHTASSLTHICGQELLGVINGGHRHLSLRHEGVVVGVVGDQQHVCPGKGQGRGQRVGRGQRTDREGLGEGRRGPRAGREEESQQGPQRDSKRNEKVGDGVGRGGGQRGMTP